MTTNSIINQSPYLRSSRLFPQNNQEELAEEVNLAYVDTANAVNARIIGIYPENKVAITGETWYFTGRKQQTQRKIFTFTAAGMINHNIGASLQQISPKSYGQFTDGTNWYGVIFASSVGIAGQYSFYVTPTQIVVLDGGGTPAITSGFVVLEWLTNAVLKV